MGILEWATSPLGTTSSDSYCVVPDLGCADCRPGCS